VSVQQGSLLGEFCSHLI